MPKFLPNSDPSWFGFLLTVREDAPFTRDKFIQHLQKKKIGTRYLFGGNLLKQPYFIDGDINYRKVGDLKNTDLVMNNTFWIGVYPGITKEMLDYIKESFKEFLS